MLGYINKLLIFLPFFVFSNIQDSIQKIELENVIVKSTKVNTNIKLVPLSVTVKDLSITKNYSSKNSFSDFTKSVPGLYTSSSENFSQDLRISLRGFGARSSFGVRGLKLIVDGIPQTTPDGQTQLDNLPLGLISNIEILRGPNSSIYGNSSGGVITINTISNNSQNYYRNSAIFGAYQFQSIGRTRVYDWEDSSLILYYNRKKSNGYRDFGDYKSTLFNIKYLSNLNEKNKIALQINYANNPYEYDPGGLTISEVDDNRRQFRQKNFDYDTFEKVKHLNTGLSWTHLNNDSSFFESYLFYQNRDFNSKLPFKNGGIISLNRDYYGFGTKYSKEYLNENNLRTTVIGIDYSNQFDDRKRYINNLGERGEISFDQIEKFSNIGTYLINQTQYNSGLIIRYSLRYDNNKIGTDSETLINLNKVNPSLGISYTLGEFNNLYFSTGTSFETPTLNELSNNPNGSGLNNNLKSNSAINYELGWRRSSSNMMLEASLYLINSSNEILPYEIEEFPGKNFYQNVGSTNRYGFELSSKFFFDGGKFSLAYTNSKNIFKDFKINDNNLEGKSLPGIPNQILDAEINLYISTLSTLNISNRIIGELYADNKNETQISSYNLLSLSFVRKIFGQNEIYFGINNLLNKEYFDNIRINAFGKRYYEPAPTRNFYIGLNISF